MPGGADYGNRDMLSYRPFPTCIDPCPLLSVIPDAHANPDKKKESFNALKGKFKIK